MALRSVRARCHGRLLPFDVPGLGSRPSKLFTSSGAVQLSTGTPSPSDRLLSLRHCSLCLCHDSVASAPYRLFSSGSARRIPPSSFPSSSWLVTATACVSTVFACLYSSFASCEAAAISVETVPKSAAQTAHLTFAPPLSQPLSPLPQLTGSNELDWQLVRQLQFLLAQPDAALTPEEQHYLQTRMSDPSTCFRYLLARGGDLQRAAQGIKSTTRWRVNNHVDALTAASLVDKLTDSHMWLSEGTARDGTPLIITKKSTKAETDHERQFQLIVYTLERALRTLALRNSTLPPPTPPTPTNPKPLPLTIASDERWSWFIDLEAFNSGSSTPLSETRRIVDTLMNQYVERLNVKPQHTPCHAHTSAATAASYAVMTTDDVWCCIVFVCTLLGSYPAQPAPVLLVGVEAGKCGSASKDKSKASNTVRFE